MKSQIIDCNTMARDNSRAKRLTINLSKTIIMAFVLACLCLYSAHLFATTVNGGYIRITGQQFNGTGSFSLSGNGFTASGQFNPDLGWWVQLPLGLDGGTISVKGNEGGTDFSVGSLIIGGGYYPSVNWGSGVNGPPGSVFTVTGGPDIRVTGPGTYTTTFAMTGSLCGMVNGRPYGPCDLPMPDVSGIGTVTVVVVQQPYLHVDSATYNFCACVPPPSNMVAWYPFDQTGSAQNDLAQGNTATAHGTTSIAGEVSNALQFDGTASYVQAPDQSWLNMGTGNLSMDAWVKIKSSTDDSSVVVLVDKRQSSPILGYHFFLYYGRLGLQLADSTGYSNYISATAVPADNQWHLVAVTVVRNSHTGGVWYLDGHPIDVPFDPTARIGSLNSTGTPLLIGVQQPGLGGAGFFKGGLDELEIFNRVLSATEVQSLYQAGPAGKCK